MSEDLERAIGPDRRTFIKRLVIGTAFAAPVVSSFTMSGVRGVFGSQVGALTGALNCNGIPPTAPPNYPRPIASFDSVVGVDETVFDDGVTLRLQVQKYSFIPDVCIMIFGGDLNALKAAVPNGEKPVSAYAVVWLGPEGSPNSIYPITLTVTDPAVKNGDPIYKFDKATGALVSQGTAAGNTWVVHFVEDPQFVVTGESDDDDDHRKKATAQPATPVAAQASFTG